MFFLSDFYKGMCLFGKKVSIFINTILLLIAYVFGIGLTAIIAKLIDKNFLKLRIEKDKTSYWEETHITDKEVSEFLKQY
jgi:hypothetical protein